MNKLFLSLTTVLLCTALTQDCLAGKKTYAGYSYSSANNSVEEESGCSWISQKWHNLSTCQKAAICTTGAIIGAGTVASISVVGTLCATGSLAICAAKGLQTTTASPLFSEPPTSILGQPIDPHQIDGAEEMLTEGQKKFGPNTDEVESPKTYALTTAEKQCSIEMISRYTTTRRGDIIPPPDWLDDSSVLNTEHPCETPGEHQALERCLRQKCPDTSESIKAKKEDYKKGLALQKPLGVDLTEFCNGDLILDSLLTQDGVSCPAINPESVSDAQKRIAIAIREGVTYPKDFAMDMENWNRVRSSEQDQSLCVTPAAREIVSHITGKLCYKNFQTVTVDSPSRLAEGLHITAHNVPAFLQASMRDVLKRFETLITGSDTMPNGFKVNIYIKNIGAYDPQNIASAGPSQWYPHSGITKNCGMSLSTDHMVQLVAKKGPNATGRTAESLLTHEMLHCFLDWNIFGIVDPQGNTSYRSQNGLSPMMEKFTDQKTGKTYYLLTAKPCKDYAKTLQQKNPSFYKAGDPRIGKEGLPITGDDHMGPALLRSIKPNALHWGGFPMLDGAIACGFKSLGYQIDPEGFKTAYPDLVAKEPQEPYDADYNY